MPIHIKTTSAQDCPIVFTQFSGGERHVQIPAESLLKLPKHIRIEALIHNSADLMDYLLLENVLLEHGCVIDLVMPYLPYARQDRRCASGQAFSLDLLTRMLNLNPATAAQRRRLTVWDVHSEVSEVLLQQQTQFQQIINRSPAEIIAQSPALTDILTDDHTVLICPDAGAVPRSQAIAKVFNTLRRRDLEIIYAEKKRDPQSGKIIRTQVHATDLSGKTAVICDDICDGGATFLAIAEQLKQLNCAQIVLYVTHGIFSRGLDVFDGLIDQIFCSNSFAQAQLPKRQIDPQTTTQTTLQARQQTAPQSQARAKLHIIQVQDQQDIQAQHAQASASHL